MSVLPDLDRPDTFAMGLSLPQFAQAVGAGVLGALMLGGIGLQVKLLHVRNFLIVMLEVTAVAIYAGLALAIVKYRQHGLPATQWARMAWKWWRLPRYWVNAPKGIGVPAKLREAVDSWKLGVLNLPWSGYTDDGDVLLGNNQLRRILSVTGVDLELRSEGERAQLSKIWRRVVDALDDEIEIVARIEEINLQDRIVEAEALSWVDGMGMLAAAHSKKLKEFDGRIQRHVFVVVKGNDTRLLDARESDLASSLAPMRLKVERVMGDARPWKTPDDDYLLPVPVAVHEHPSYLEVL